MKQINQMKQMKQMNQMNQMNQIQDNEIDLFQLFHTLWGGKWLISAFVGIAVSLGGGFISLKDAEYESKLSYSLGTFPPFYLEQKVLNDFENKFYSVSTFEDWKKNHSGTPLLFDDFSATVAVDGFVFSKNEGDQLATIKEVVARDKKEVFVLITSNNLPILDDFFEYADYINDLLTVEYVARAKDELSVIETRLQDSKLSNVSIANESIITRVLSTDRYIVEATKGAKVLEIKRSTMPKKISPKSSLILFISLVLGGFVGVMYVLISSAIRKRKEKLAKA